MTEPEWKDSWKNDGLMALAELIHDNKIRHKWAITNRDAWKNSTTQVPADLMLIVSELAEALEAFRRDDFENFADELADAFVRIVGLCDALEIDLWWHAIHVVLKSAKRPISHGGKRL